jgi:hypothetical protein
MKMSNQNIPVPDPSKMTTAVIHREIGAIQEDMKNLQENFRIDVANRQKANQRELEQQEELFAAKLEGVKSLLEAELKSIVNLSELRIKEINNIPEKIKDAVVHHEDLQVERFNSIRLQFQERDIRTAQAQEASAQALAAALQAAKELVGAQGEASAAAAVKSETSFTKQIDQIGTIIQTLEKALDARITELKERIDRGEGQSNGESGQRQESRSNIGTLVGAGGLLISLLTVLIASFLN